MVNNRSHDTIWLIWALNARGHQLAHWDLRQGFTQSTEFTNRRRILRIFFILSIVVSVSGIFRWFSIALLQLRFSALVEGLIHSNVAGFQSFHGFHHHRQLELHATNEVDSVISGLRRLRSRMRPSSVKCWVQNEVSDEKWLPTLPSQSFTIACLDYTLYWIRFVFTWLTWLASTSTL